MSTPSRFVLGSLALLAACATPHRAETPLPKFGEPVSVAELARWDISIPPSGAGLPAGSGTAREGLKVYEAK
jgi:hypothetical protein